jgi:selenocysteine lyase/cysteine desulfurase
MRHGKNVYLRYSVQAFNYFEDVDKLFNALKGILKSSNFVVI